jgi:NADH-quinone oxidoreductase subunit L
MSQLLQLFIIIPLTGLIISLLVPRKKETVLSLVAISTMSVHMCLVLAFGAYWLLNGYPVLDIRHIVLFSTEDFEIFISFFFDKITAVHAFTGSVLTFLVVIFSRYYLHREAGFKRFFTTLLFFYTGYNIVIFSGNFETFFIGWEVLGITSFLLIAFYRDRYLPVKNGFKVISLYRFSDVCLLLAMWMSKA